MYLKSLELSGFKSFAKKGTLSFNTPITGIVGPNGSGKSNVAEAFRFVLGEQSIKSLRGKRGEDLIWNGGGDVQSGTGRANRAQVKLVFDNSRRMFKGIDFDEVTMERLVHRDGINEYLLNGTQVRLKDIAELLATAHIGSTGHHIISQGEADRILSASIRERREMIEDALGLKIYQWKKIESLKKLERTDDNMKQVESLRREIAPHLRFLKKQVEKLEKAEEMKKDLARTYREYFHFEDRFIVGEKTRIKGEIEGPKKEMQDLDKALENAKRILSESTNKDTKSDEILKLEQDLAEVRRMKDGVVREIGRIEGEMGAYERTIQREKEKQAKDEFKTVYLRDVEEIVGKIETMSSMSDVKALFNEVVTTLKSFISKHKGQAESSLIAESEKEMVVLGSKKQELETKIATSKAQEASLVSTYNILKENIEREKDTNRDAEKEVFKVIARQNEVRNVLSKLEAEMVNIIRLEDDFKRKLGEAGISVGRDAVDYKNVDLGGLADSRDAQEDRRRQIEKFNIRLEDAGLGGGSEVLKEYRETNERDTFLAKELLDLETAKAELENLIKELEVRIDVEFKSGILKINTEFQKYFSLMFGGGKAQLDVVKEIRRKKKSDAEDLSDALKGAEMGDMGDDERGLASRSDLDEEQGPEGLDVSVSLPKKKVKGLIMLSGGERALTSIALLFAISQVNPPPFIILDETDAALDEANSRKYGDMIENLSKHSQLILITHNRETMSRAGVLYGVTMGGDGASKLLSIQFEEAVAVAK